MEKTINIAKDFSSTLGGRRGPYSGEEFYISMLEKAFLNAYNSCEKLIIELDGTKGYPSSFLDQSFGELTHIYGVKAVRNTIQFRTVVFQWIADFINQKTFVPSK